MSNPAYPNPIPVKSLADRLGEVTADSSHAFLADDVSVLDVTEVDAMRIHGPRQITDVYLLALAVRQGARFVTFDRGVAMSAVRLAKAANHVVL